MRDSVQKIFHHPVGMKTGIPLTHESLMVIRVITRRKTCQLTKITHSGPSSVWRQFKCSGTILSKAMSMSAILLARKFLSMKL